MPSIQVIKKNGDRVTIQAAVGQSVMRSVIDSGVDGIEAECGGCLSCATCHAYVAPEWVDRLPAPTEEERSMLECAVDERENSRLTCQIVMTDELDGLEIEVPASQI